MEQNKVHNAPIPFSPPRIDEASIAEVVDTLRSGWITTGPKTKEFEKRISAYCGAQKTICLNSGTAAMEMMLHWYGIGPGDEVIIPAYTYCATANVVEHSGATIKMVDVNPDDFNMSIEAVRDAITEKTKVIVPVDIGGFPCDYDAHIDLVNEEGVKKQFSPNNDKQRTLGRIMILADAAHSFGASYKGKMSGASADASAFSFHAVKNLTTAEGGALVFNMPKGFDVQEIYKTMNTLSLHGQSKDALAKSTAGGWRYDVNAAGFKCNMTDIHASLGLVEITRYKENLARRKEIFEKYDKAFESRQWAQLPIYSSDDKISSYHLYMLRIKNCSEEQRNEIMKKIAQDNISVNVHFIPIPMLSFYKERGFDIADYPVAFDNYSREISLPVYYNLTDEQVDRVIISIIHSVEAIL